VLYYKKINIPNYDIIKSELEHSTSEFVKNNTRFWDVPYTWFQLHSPTLYNFVEKRKKLPVRLCRFYLTPPNGALQPHIDGLKNNRSPLGLNLPITGYQNTTMSWWECSKDNLIDGPYGFNNITASKIISVEQLVKADSTTVDVPTFVRTDEVHSIESRNSSPRLVLSIRFLYSTASRQEFDDVFDLTDL
jgi:hypothetical protein